MFYIPKLFDPWFEALTLNVNAWMVLCQWKRRVTSTRTWTYADLVAPVLLIQQLELRVELSQVQLAWNKEYNHVYHVDRNCYTAFGYLK